MDNNIKTNKIWGKKKKNYGHLIFYCFLIKFNSDKLKNVSEDRFFIL